MRLITNIKLECALFGSTYGPCARDQPKQEFSFRFKSIVRGHHVYKGALNKKYFDNRIKPAPNSEYALISEVRLTTREYGIRLPVKQEVSAQNTIIISSRLESLKLVRTLAYIF